MECKGKALHRTKAGSEEENAGKQEELSCRKEVKARVGESTQNLSRMTWKASVSLHAWVIPKQDRRQGHAH